MPRADDEHADPVGEQEREHDREARIRRYELQRALDAERERALRRASRLL